MLTPPAILASLFTLLTLERFLMVDWHRYLHAVAASSLSTMAGANVFETNRTLDGTLLAATVALIHTTKPTSPDFLPLD